MPAPFKPPPTGTLPPKGKRLHARVYEESRLRGYDKDSAAAIAWTAVKNAGYRKVGGVWRAPGSKATRTKSGARKKRPMVVLGRAVMG